jgi:LysR family transcriptional regulator (chromosome initiation inhibitor)
VATIQELGVGLSWDIQLHHSPRNFVVARNFNRRHGQALSQIGGAGREQPIHISIVGPTSVMTSRIVDLCSDLYDDWPNLCLNLIMSDTEDRLNLVRSGKAALAIVPPEQVPNEMDSKVLRAEKYILVASPKWKGRRLVDILESERIIDFDESDQTSINYLKKFSLVSKLKRTRFFANNNEAIIKLFSQGVGFGTLTQETAKQHLDSGELIPLNGGAVMDEPLALTWYPRHEMPEYFRAIVGAVK